MDRVKWVQDFAARLLSEGRNPTPPLLGSWSEWQQKWRKGLDSDFCGFFFLRSGSCLTAATTPLELHLHPHHKLSHIVYQLLKPRMLPLPLWSSLGCQVSASV